MTDKSSSPIILGGSSESEGTSPRISFSRDFVQADRKRGTIRVNDGMQYYSPDFEFAMTTTSFNPAAAGGLHPTQAMLPADELICDGKLLPFGQSQYYCTMGRRSFSSFTSAPLIPQLRASTIIFPPSSNSPVRPSLSTSNPALGVVPPPQFSPNCNGPKFGAKWREMFQFRTKFEYEREKKTRGPLVWEEKGPSKLSRLFSRSRSVGRGREIDHLAMTQKENAESHSVFKTISDHSSSIKKHSSRLSLRIDHSPSVDSDDLIDREGCFGSPARLGKKPRGNHNIDQLSIRSMIKSSSWTSPGRIFRSSKRKIVNPERKSILKKYNFSFMSDVEEGSTARHARVVQMKSSTGIRSNTYKTKIHRRAEMIGCGEYWRIGDNKTASYSKARVAPVLLINVPTCMASSLRGVKASKAKLMNLRHLFTPRTAIHHFKI